MDWKGDKSLPMAFILFLMMAALFIGEVMPVVIGIFFGHFDVYGAKEPIIKTVPDFELVLIIYVLLGSLFWILYRYINWRIVVAFGFVLAFLLERFVYTQAEGSINLITSASVGTFIEFIIVYFLVLVLPYFVFQKSRNTWGKRGITILLGIIFALNALGLGFTYYHLISTDWYEKHSSGSGRQSQFGGGEITYPDLAMVTPYVNESDIRFVGAFGGTDENPWGFKHVGIDFMTATDLVPFRAVADGIVEKVRSSRDGPGWHSEFCINHNPFLVCYNFETFSPGDIIGQRQRDNIFVKNGDEIKQGDVIGKLVHGSEGAHVDLGVVLLGGSGARVCPEPYFTEEAKASVLRLIRKDHPTWNMCY